MRAMSECYNLYQDNQLTSTLFECSIARHIQGPVTKVNRKVFGIFGILVSMPNMSTLTQAYLSTEARSYEDPMPRIVVCVLLSAQQAGYEYDECIPAWKIPSAIR